MIVRERDSRHTSNTMIAMDRDARDTTRGKNGQQRENGTHTERETDGIAELPESYRIATIRPAGGGGGGGAREREWSDSTTEREREMGIR